ncbi:hypothetical protein GQ602_000349 [Ophiocordyceps camponoti-floridani]|uniref:MYND-type domain-containing protein n=1 Tax=Ophiocordyceps camponoti-floridani TaxID=2030778 RepID=A0A8H4VGE4_9HYPO|nr:hypothetical protein GQ602_000349 [Ophiocordyceps camponoti-floridani]
MAETTLSSPRCAHWTAKGFSCTKPATKTCANCKLVVYCGADCQRQHWPEHKKQCKSDMAKPSWRPGWDRQHRRPAWTFESVSERYRGSFGASGDLRHVVKTLAHLPDTIDQKVLFVINDKDSDVVARNAILLLLAFDAARSPGDDEAASVSATVEAIIHLWYSAFIPQRVLTRLQQSVGPLINEMCYSIATQPADHIFRKSWEASDGACLSLSLQQKTWFRLRRFLNVPAGITKEKATRIRDAVTSAPERADYRDRWHYNEATPFGRIAKERFRQDGLLLPYGHPRLGFDIPNPTLFQSSSWSLNDKADPRDGWAISEVQRCLWPASEDWYGRLTAHLTALLGKFIAKLGKNNVSFQMHNTDARVLPYYLEDRKFNRIEVSNICDAGYIGFDHTLCLYADYLQHPEENPHATLIGTFINGVKEVSLLEDTGGQIPNIGFLTRMLPPPSILSLTFWDSADITRLWDARYMARDVDALFRKYAELCRFDSVAAENGVEMKTDNTIVDKWPTRFKIQPGEEAKFEEFRLCLAAGFNHLERCVEWKRRPEVISES